MTKNNLYILIRIVNNLYKNIIYKTLYLLKININKTKKFGVLVASTNNLGDDIQALAQINILNKMGINDYVYIDREKLSDYKGSPVNLIMNGWFMHDIKKFPPSEKINPIFISTHIAKERLVADNKWYWKLHEPIGCRDEYTRKLFEKYKINSYLSKCLTLTFDRSNEKRDGIYFVDINTCDYIPKISEQFLNSIPYKNVEYLRHDINDNTNLTNYDFRLNKANKLLDIYRKAELVITSRLHCALPCRAFGTPVVFVHKFYKDSNRFNGLYKELNGSDDSVDFKEIDPLIDYEIVEAVKKKLQKDLESRLHTTI